MYAIARRSEELGLLGHLAWLHCMLFSFLSPAGLDSAVRHDIWARVLAMDVVNWDHTVECMNGSWHH